MALKKIMGQNFRVFVDGLAVEEETNCSVSINGNMEDSSTKNSENNFSEEQMTSKSWQVQVDHVDSDEGTLRRLLRLAKSLTDAQVSFDHTTGPNNKTAANAGFSRSGKALLTDLSIQANNRQTISISCQYTGNGPLE